MSLPDVRSPHRDERAFGAVLRGRRVDRRLTQEQLAAATGLSTRSISNLERGDVRHPRPETVRLLADGLRLDGAELADFAARARADYWAQRAAQPPACPAAPAAGGEGKPGRPTPRVPAQLPPIPAGFVGRSTDVAQLDSWLPPGPADPGCPVVIAAVCGPAGIGKSGLAVHWAQRVRHRFDGGQLHVDLRGWSRHARLSVAEALGQLLRGLDVPPEQVPADVTQATNLYRTVTADRRLLVVLDNARDVEQVRPLVPTGAGSMVIVTSRHALAGLVAREGARRLRLHGLSQAEAGELIEHVVGSGAVRADPDGVADLARLCGHLPLALRIAAANLLDRPDVGLDRYCQDLRSNRLAALDPGGDEHDGVRATFSLSYDALPAAARQLFRHLGVMPAHDVTVSGAAALAGVDTRQGRRLLDRLTASHLLERRQQDRLALHDLLRLYAIERSEQEDGESDRTAARVRLLRHYLRTVRAAAAVVFPETQHLPQPAELPSDDLPFATPEEALAWLDAECANLVAAVDAAAEHGPHRMSVLLADALRGYFRRRPRRTEWAAVADRGLAAAKAHAEPSGLAAARLNLAALHLARDDYRLSIDEAGQAASLAQASGWLAGQATAAAVLGNAHRLSGQLADAAGHLNQARSLYREAGAADGEASVLDTLGLLAHETGRLRDAAACFDRALLLHSAAGCADRHLADTLLALGDVCRSLGRPDDALRHLTRALSLHRALGDRTGEAYTLRCLAEVHRDRGEPERALRAAEDAAAAAVDIGDRRTEAQALQTRATVELRMGRPAAAISGHLQALALATAVGNHYTVAEAHLGLARARRHARHPERSEAHARQARTIANSSGYHLLRVEALHILGDLSDDQNRPDQAQRHHHEAATISTALDGAP